MPQDTGRFTDMRIELLASYRDMSMALLQLVESGELEDLEKLSNLLTLRDKLISDLQNMSMDNKFLSNQQPILSEIGNLDNQINNNLQAVHQSTKHIIQNLTAQKRGLQGYQESNVFDGAFIDRKK